MSQQRPLRNQPPKEWLENCKTKWNNIKWNLSTQTRENNIFATQIKNSNTFVTDRTAKCTIMIGGTKKYNTRCQRVLKQSPPISPTDKITWVPLCEEESIWDTHWESHCHASPHCSVVTIAVFYWRQWTSFVVTLIAWIVKWHESALPAAEVIYCS